MLDRALTLSFQETLLSDQILLWYLERGTGQNLTGYAEMLGWSHHKVKRNMTKLVDMEIVFAKQGKYYPTPYFVSGSMTSDGVVAAAIETVHEIERLCEDQQHNTPAHQARQKDMDEKVNALRGLYDGLDSEEG